MRRAIALAVVSALTLACGGDTPTSPAPFVPTFTRGGLPSNSPILLANCSADGVDVSCYATLIAPPPALGSTDVTQAAQWSVTPAGVMTMIAPGRFRPLRAGEVAISVSHQDGVALVNPMGFLVAPADPARSLTSGIFNVMESPTVPVVAAMVEILDGYRAGARCLTISFGVCEIERIPVGDSFSVRISKAGYKTQTVTFTPQFPTSSPFVSVMLVKQ